jgi:hypothetical protein
MRASKPEMNPNLHGVEILVVVVDCLEDVLDNLGLGLCNEPV